MSKKRQGRVFAIIIIAVISILMIISLVFLFTNQNYSTNNNSLQVPNPAKTYCEDAGFNYKIKNTDKGEQGFCVFLDNSECDAWSYFCGCTNDQRYCSKSYSSCLYECK